MALVAQTPICGIGIGAENCYVAVARQGGIEIVLNEYSQYATPAFVLLGGQQRELGTSAKQGQMAHIQSTIFAPSLLLGKKYSELDMSSIPFAVEEGPEDSILIRVTHNEEELVLTPTQILAMLFTKLRHISGNAVDCVVNVPNFFSDIQRRQMLDAAQIAGLNPLKLINDTTAVALFYGFYRNPSGRDSSILCFFDCGQSSTQSSIYLFNHKENTLQILDTRFEPSVGGRDFDQVIGNYFIETQKMELNKRARCRLYAECEKLKKQMSASSNELPVNIECLHNDQDFSGRMDRAKFQELATPLFQKIENMLVQNLQAAKLEYDRVFAAKFGEFKVDSVEIFGGSSRVAAIKQMIKSLFGVEPSTTLNADEAVARGCALQCAILSPNFKIAKSLNLLDGTSYETFFRFDHNGDGADMKFIGFPRGTLYPRTKKITGYCKKFPIKASIDFLDSAGNTHQSSEYVIDQPQGTDLTSHLENNPIIFRLKFDSNGLVFLQSATLTFEKSNGEGESMEQATENGDEDMEVDVSAEKKKKKTTSCDLEVCPISIIGRLSQPEVEKAIEFEGNLVLADKIWKEKTDAKNALEEYIYEWREKLSSFEVFIDPASKETFQKLLEENEKWLFEQEDEGIMHSKSVYEERSDKMKNEFSNKILFRKREFEQHQSFLENLGHNLQQASKFVESAQPDEKETSDKLQKEIQAKQEYFNQSQGILSNWNPNQDPPVTCEEISSNARALQTSLIMAQNSRKRIIEERKKSADDALKNAKAAEEAGKEPTESMTSDDAEFHDAEPGKPDMEVD